MSVVLKISNSFLEDVFASILMLKKNCLPDFLSLRNLKVKHKLTEIFLELDSKPTTIKKMKKNPYNRLYRDKINILLK